MECHYCHLNTRKAYCSKCLQQKLSSSHEEEQVMKKERDQLISQADELIKKATVVQSLLVEKNKRLKQLEYSKEQQQSISKRCLLKSKRITELKKQIQQKQKMHNESLARRQIHLSNDMRYKNQLNKKLKAWQQVHKRTITQRRSLMEQVKTWYEITKHKDGVYICGQTLPTCVIEIPKYPTEELNAATHLVIHLLELITSYLGIKLPFYISQKGLDYRIELARSNTIVKKKKIRMHLFISEGEKNYQKFVEGMAMLNYNIAYLCHTQGIEIPLNHKVTHTMQNLVACLNTPLPSKLGVQSHALCYYGIRNLDFSMNFKQVLQETRQCYKYHPPVDIEEKISEMDLNDQYFTTKSHSEREQQRADDTEDDELYSDSDQDDDNEKKTIPDDDIQSENWNLVDVMTSFGNEGVVEENGGGESIFQLGASRIPDVLNMMSAKSQQSPISHYLYRRR